MTAESAHWAGGWADGSLTLGGALEKVRYTIHAFDEGGGVGNPVHLQIAPSYAHNETSARQRASDQWRTTVFFREVLAELWMLAPFEAEQLLSPQPQRKMRSTPLSRRLLGG